MSTDDRPSRPNQAATLARAHGAFNVVGGVWPLVSRRSFEAIFGSKYDRWLQFTVAGLLAGNGLVQLTAARTPAGLASARRLGLTTAGWLLAIDLIYVPKGTIRKTYLLDAAMEIGWLAAWQGRYGRIEST
ncbi:hypothetical protein ACSVDM_22400 [Nocardia sp. JW2]|uniref:hypothetical protein n=1 Tax=Nocardia sp. JW2 TaxID=3450738 RepID=UPI003F430C25